MTSRLIIVDISSFIFRAHFAIRPMHNPAGVQVNAVYGVLTMMMKLLSANKPSHIILAKDLSGGSFRNEMYPEYKANRGAAPEELIPQFSLIDQLIESMRIPSKSVVNYEADDVIGSLATQFKDQFDEILIASSDKDLMQFVDDKVKMLDTMKGKTYGPKEVFEKMGVHPNQIVDYLSLLGDTSDNIPGVKGIGAKGAASMLAQFPTLDQVIENIDEITNKRAKTSLSKGIESAHLSRKLVQIVTDLKLELNKDDLKFELAPHEELLTFLDDMNFKSIKSKIETGGEGSTRSSSLSINYSVIKTNEKYKDMIELLEGEDQVFIEPYFLKDETYHSKKPMTVSFSTNEKTFLLYLGEEFLFENIVKDLSEIEDLNIITNSSKAFYYIMPGIENEIFDLTQAHFVLDPDKKHDLASICSETMNEYVLNEKELAKEKLEAEQSIKNFEFALAKRAYLGLRSYPWLLKELAKSKLLSIYSELDAPLNNILSRMEKEGIAINCDFFKSTEKSFQTQIDEIETKIEEIGGDKINLNSPKQVGVLLFDKLELPVIKKTKTGYSTDVTVLETLAGMEESEVPALILRHREINKLLSTYVKTIPLLVDKESRIHTHYNQANAATGRLSSDQPNLQNIPVKTENGKKLRGGFVAKEGFTFVGADYSQVELRILAHLSEDDVMVNSFNNDEDIHSQTAAQIFDIPFEDVTSSERSYAKAINFGLMYGQSSFGLSQMLKISPGEAKEYITSYFKRFSKVKAYLDILKESCEETGYTKTIFGRKRLIKDINSSNRQIKSMAERMAINTPIQGTAADIIKKAMLSIDEKLTQKKLKSKMILQVHDELIFEVPNNEVEEMKKLIKTEMESVIELRVPLKVDINSGASWLELK